MVAESKLPARAWLIVGLLWIVGCLNYLDRVMITTMRESLVAAIPMTDAQFGLLTSVFLWVYAVLSPFAGFLADRVSRSRVILGSFFAWSLTTWLTAHATTFGELLATRALMGISEACYIPAALALISDYHRTTTRSRANGIHLSGLLAGAALGGLGGWIAERHDWSRPFQVFGGAGVCYSLVLILFLRDAPRALADSTGNSSPPKVRLGEAFRSLFSRGAFILAFFYWGVLGLAGWGVVGWMPTYLHEHFHLAQGVAGLTATVYVQTSCLVGVVVGGIWADRWSRTNDRAPIYVPIIGLCVAAPGMMVVGYTNLLPVAIAALILYGLARAFADANMMPILCMLSDRRYRATGYGVLNFFGCAVGGLAVYAGGALRDAQIDVSRIFQFSALSLLGCAVMLCFLRLKALPPTPAPATPPAK